MAIETLDDIAEEVANLIGVYGAHDEVCDHSEKTCRMCFVSSLRERIERAAEVERKLRTK